MKKNMKVLEWIWKTWISRELYFTDTIPQWNHTSITNYCYNWNDIWEINYSLIYMSQVDIVSQPTWEETFDSKKVQAKKYFIIFSKSGFI